MTTHDAEIEPGQGLSTAGTVQLGIRTADLTSISWWTVLVGIATFVAAALRFIGLDWVALSASEANESYRSLSLFDGRPLGAGQSIPDESPVLYLSQAASFLLFGVTDVTARVGAVLAGIFIVLLAAAFRPFVGREVSLAMVVLTALSPTLVYASRIASSEVMVGAFSLAFLITILFAGKRSQEGQSVHVWSAASGAAFAAVIGSGPSSISVVICLLIGIGMSLAVEQRSSGPLRGGVKAVFGNTQCALIFVLSSLLTASLIFTRLLSEPGAVTGVATTFTDWIDLLATDPSATPTQFFLLAVFLYETLVILGVVGTFFFDPKSFSDRLNPMLFGGWTISALVIFSFSSGREPEQAIHVALPLVLWGSYGITSLVTRLPWIDGGWKKTVPLVATIGGLLAAVVALAAAIGRVDEAPSTGRAMFDVFAILVLAVAPLAIATYLQLVSRVDEKTVISWRTGATAFVVALVVFLGVYGFRSTMMLNYYRADTSTELLAQKTSTTAVPALVQQVTNLSRDLTVREGSTRDPTGGHGISIALEEGVEWPFRWYFRDFPDTEIVATPDIYSSDADLILAADAADMEMHGYTPRSYAYQNRVPPEYVAPSLSSVLKTVILPTRWSDGYQFLIYRDGLTIPDPAAVISGYGQTLANKLFPSSGPYDLDDRPGPGAGRGQFVDPRGISVSPADGSTYVVDMGNGRIQRFSSSGEYEASWGGAESEIDFEVTAEDLGPTGIANGFDGLIYVADTWNHRIVVLNQSGSVVREFGMFGDTFDSEDPGVQSGEFFGPRSVSLSADEVFVADTGNERVQVFAPDGTFLRAWGGYGNGPGQFIEPVGIAFGPDGRVFVADSGNARISVFSREGAPLEQWPVAAWEGNQFFEPYLAFDRFGRLYATSSATGSVEVFDPDGTHVASIIEAGGQTLQTPIGIAMAIDGTMLVSDSGQSAILRLDPIPPPDPSQGLIESSPVAASPIVEATPEQ